MIGRTLAQYRIFEKLGEGGMGVVYRARDLNLGRDVAIKVLPPGTLSDAAAHERFCKEAKALARLNHPHIELVYHFDTLDGVDCLVTEFVAGETLAAQLRVRTFPEAELREVGAQIAAALAAAHAKGIVHCDLKPANVILTPEGQVKLLDFGLARTLRPPGPVAGDDTTQTMLVAGTVPYMAPEQLLGAPPDPRTDVYAAGVLLFELATGRRPFCEAQQAALIDAILHQAPPDPRSLQPTLSRTFAQTILGCLEKQPARRCGSAKSLENALQSPAAAARPKMLARIRLAAMAAVILAAVLFGFLWLVGSRPVLSFAPRDFVLVADFENQTGDAVFDQSLLTAFVVSLEQSRLVNVVPRSRIRGALRRMRKSGDEKIDEALSQEVASREGIKAVIVPSISGIGSEYRLAARIRDVSSGTDVKTRVVRAAGKDRVLGAVDQLASGIREDLGESLLALSGNTRRLQRVTTASLEALKQYTAGIDSQRKTNFNDARMYYEQALRIAPQFTAARASLGMLLFENFDKQEGARLLDAAVHDLDHLTDREKYGTLAFHASAVEHNLEKAVGFQRALLTLHPDESAAHNNLGLLYRQLHRCQEAAAEFQEALRIDPNLQLSYMNLSYTYLFCLGDLDGAIRTGKLQLGNSETQPWAFANLGLAYLGEGRLVEAETVFRRSVELFPNFTINRYRLGMTYRFEQRWTDAIQAFEEILALDRDECYANYEIAITHDRMQQAAASRSDLARAQACLERGLKTNPKDASTPMLLGLVLARLGRPAEAMAAAAGALKLNPDLGVEEAAVLAALGKGDRALDSLEQAVQKGYNNLVWIQVHPEFQRFRGNPRFTALFRERLKGAAL